MSRPAPAKRTVPAVAKPPPPAAASASKAAAPKKVVVASRPSAPKSRPSPPPHAVAPVVAVAAAAADDEDVEMKAVDGDDKGGDVEAASDEAVLDAAEADGDEQQAAEAEAETEAEPTVSMKAAEETKAADGTGDVDMPAASGSGSNSSTSTGGGAGSASGTSGKRKFDQMAAAAAATATPPQQPKSASTRGGGAGDASAPGEGSHPPPAKKLKLEGKVAVPALPESKAHLVDETADIGGGDNDDNDGEAATLFNGIVRDVYVVMVHARNAFCMQANACNARHGVGQPFAKEKLYMPCRPPQGALTGSVSNMPCCGTIDESRPPHSFDAIPSTFIDALQVMTQVITFLDACQTQFIKADYGGTVSPTEIQSISASIGTIAESQACPAFARPAIRQIRNDLLWFARSTSLPSNTPEMTDFPATAIARVQSALEQATAVATESKRATATAPAAAGVKIINNDVWLTARLYRAIMHVTNSLGQSMRKRSADTEEAAVFARKQMPLIQDCTYTGKLSDAITVCVGKNQRGCCVACCGGVHRNASGAIVWPSIDMTKVSLTYIQALGYAATALHLVQQKSFSGRGSSDQESADIIGTLIAKTDAFPYEIREMYRGKCNELLDYFAHPSDLLARSSRERKVDLTAARTGMVASQQPAPPSKKWRSRRFDGDEFDDDRGQDAGGDGDDNDDDGGGGGGRGGGGGVSRGKSSVFFDDDAIPDW